MRRLTLSGLAAACVFIGLAGCSGAGARAPGTTAAGGAITGTKKPGGGALGGPSALPAPGSVQTGNYAGGMKSGGQ